MIAEPESMPHYMSPCIMSDHPRALVCGDYYVPLAESPFEQVHACHCQASHRTLAASAAGCLSMLSELQAALQACSRSYCRRASSHSPAACCQTIFWSWMACSSCYSAATWPLANARCEQCAVS